LQEHNARTGFFEPDEFSAALAGLPDDLPGETKNAEGRQFPLTPALRAVLERQHERTLAVEEATRTIIPWLFHRTGCPEGA